MNPWSLKYVPGHLKTQEMCNEAVAHNLSNLRFVLDHFKIQEMCDDAVPMDTGMIFITSDEVLLRLSLKLKRCVEKPLKKVHGYWSLSLIVS